MKKKSLLEILLNFLKIKRYKSHKKRKVKIKDVKPFLTSKTNITTTELLKLLQRAKSSSSLFNYKEWSISLEDYMKYLEEDN